jgi:4-alpha-glucanotransferase
MKTAVEWLANRIIELEERLRYKEINLNDFMDLKDELIEQAKEMEKEQAQKYAEFAIHCDRNDFPILEFDAYMNLETFKSE